MTTAQRIASVLVRPELAGKPEYADFKQLVKEAYTTGNLDAVMVERMAAVPPK